MRTKLVSTLLLIALTAIFVVSCSHNPEPTPTQTTNGMSLKTISKTVFPVNDLPIWMMYFPQGEYTVGIARNNVKKPKLEIKSAKEFAVNSFNMNRSSYIVDKSAVINYAGQKDTVLKKEGFDVKLSLNPANADHNIELYAESQINGYKLFLYGKQKPNVNNEKMQTSAASTPEWCKWDDIFEDKEYVYALGYANETDLIDAWKKAQELALKRIAQHKLLNKATLISSTDDVNDKMQLIDSVIQSPDASIYKVFLFEKRVDDISGFSVFLLLKAKRLL